MRTWLAALISAALSVSGAVAQSCSNPVCQENRLPGTPRSAWDLSGPGSSAIQGFATNISVNRGSTASFKVKTASNNWKIDIYRLGYYQGNGARLIATINMTTAQNQPAPLHDATTGLYDAGNWKVSASWVVPASAVSGVYVAKLTNKNTPSQKNHILFIVRDDLRTSDILFQTSDTTWHAYNGWYGGACGSGSGGTNLYGGSGPGGDYAPGRAYKVSYNRPFAARDGCGTHASAINQLFAVEYPAIKWLEQNGYDVSYISGVDAARFPSLLLNHRIYVPTGHDEYWSGEQRSAVEVARSAGVHLAFLSGNEMFWKTRWEPSIDASHTPYRTLVCYKETHHNAPLDPLDASPTWTWTGTWRDPRFSPPADGGKPENALTGTSFRVNGVVYDSIEVPHPMSNLRFWRNTPNVSHTQQGQKWKLPENYLGFEWDESPDNGFAPAGLVHLSSTTRAVSNLLLRNYGSIYRDGTATHHLTLYKDRSSGSIVFGAGTVYWVWGLSLDHDGPPTPADQNVQQAMVNLFADMGVQPGTLQAGLVPAVESTDATAPTSGLSTPAGSASFATGQSFLISGWASDLGGQVAGVEVSVDGGVTWRRASGTTRWSFGWTPAAPGTYALKSRAIDDSLNIGTSTQGPTVTVAVGGSNLFSGVDVPERQTVAGDSNSVELGVKFTSRTAGFVTGIRFYKNSINEGPHTGALWTSTGTLLRSATFTNESASGWQEVRFPDPVAINANTTYVASYHTKGFYSSAANYFANASTSGPLASPSSPSSGGNGVFAYSGSVVFPSSSFNASNYWVDVVFVPANPNSPPDCNDVSDLVTPKNTALVIQASTLLANCSDPFGRTLTLTGVGNPTNGTVSFDGTSIVTFTPALNYTGPARFIFSVSNGNGGNASAAASLIVTASGPTYSLFAPSDAPAIVNVDDSSPVELGVKFRSSQAGRITGMKFYKGSQNTGVHVAHLWSAAGALLASATFANETASGWQYVTFADPVPISVGTTYVASYHSNGHYSATGNYFATARTSGPLTAPSSASSNGNGVYIYRSSGAFPSNSYNATNYWVDVMLAP